MSNLLEKLNWEVLETPVKLIIPGETPTEIIDTKHKGLVRSDNHYPLAIHGINYGTMKNSELVNYTEQVAELVNGSVLGYSEFQKGKQLLGIVKTPESIKQINDFTIQDYIIIGNSHTNRGTFVGTSIFIPRCQNQFGRILKQLVIRHTSNSLERRKAIIGLYEKYNEEVKKLYNTFKKMREVEISPDLKEAITMRLFDIETKEEMLQLSTRKQNQIEKFNASYIEETSALGENLWGLFNAGTHYSTHKVSSKNNSYGNMIGTSASFNEKLYKEIMAYV